MDPKFGVCSLYVIFDCVNGKIKLVSYPVNLFYFEVKSHYSQLCFR